MYSNAVKFTEEGNIVLHARLSPRSRYVVITISDSGSGITDDFLPKLFQAFSKEDDSLTRHSEGLGLGLMVAKGLARKLGGDLLLVRTNTSGPYRGSEFELRIPVTPADIMSRPTTPSGGSPAPSRRSSPARTDEIGYLRARSDSLRPLLASAAHPSLSSPRNRSPTKRMRGTPSPPYIPSVGPVSANKTTSNVVRTPSRRPTPAKRAPEFDRLLSQKHPLSFLVVEDNEINRKLLVNMLSKLGYKSGRDIFEAYNGSDAVRKVQMHRENSVKTRGEQGGIDVVLMDLWMPLMDGYEATQKILGMDWDDDVAVEGEEVVSDEEAEKQIKGKKPTILAVTADVTALEKAASVGMKGFLTKPFKLVDLEKLILEYCATRPSAIPSADIIPS
jgi:CheY-like chemotaxis protein